MARETRRGDRPVKAEIAELKGKMDALLTLLQGAKADLIGLPRKRPSDVA